MSELPDEVRDRAARAAYDARNEVVGFTEGRDLDRDFKVQVIAWHAVVDAVVGVVAERLAVGPTAALLLGENSMLRSQNEMLRSVLVEIRDAACDDAEWPGEVPCRSSRKDRDVWCGACLAADVLQKREELPDV